MGDYRTCDYAGLRAVTSTDGMSADFYPFDMAFIGGVAICIIKQWGQKDVAGRSQDHNGSCYKKRRRAKFCSD